MTTQAPPPTNADGELDNEIKATILRPLADKFQELTRQIDSGEYKLPETIQDAEAITEGYIDQSWERLEAIILAERANAAVEVRKTEFARGELAIIGYFKEWLARGLTIMQMAEEMDKLEPGTRRALREAALHSEHKGEDHAK